MIIDCISEMTEWIKCSERIPNLGEAVMISWNGENFDSDAFYDHSLSKWQTILEIIYDGEEIIGDPERKITHWMPLPKPPEE